MKKHFVKIRSSIVEKLFMVEQMCKRYQSKELDKYLEEQGKDPEIELIWRKVMLADFYLLQRETDNLIHQFELISNWCISELNGTYYKDHEQKWEGIDGIQYNPEKDNPFAKIARMINEGDLEMSNDLKNFVAKNAQLELTLTDGLFKHFPSLENSMVRTSTDGKVVPVKKEQILQDDFANAYKTEVNLLEGYNKFLNKLKQLAENNGNLAEIIRLLE